jgi:hypothetical protein
VKKKTRLCQHGHQPTPGVERMQIVAAAHVLAIDEDLRHGRQAACAVAGFLAGGGSAGSARRDFAGASVRLT